jgi:hypothetical protein
MGMKNNSFSTNVAGGQQKKLDHPKQKRRRRQLRKRTHLRRRRNQ